MTDSTNPTGLDFTNVASQIVTVTPKTAEAWLSRNTSNRAISSSQVKQYCADMAQGRWLFTGQAIVFDRDGVLRDGQHRLLAQARLGLTIDWNVITGTDPAAQDVIDIGRVRTIANQLQLHGQKDGAFIGSIARLDLIYGGIASPSKPQILAHVNENVGALETASLTSKRISSALKSGSTSAFGVAHFHMSAISQSLADEFAKALMDGAAMYTGNPILTVRNQLLRKNPKEFRAEAERVALVDTLHRAWNYWLVGKSVKTIATPKSRVQLISPEAVA
ncbi:hypothetical protein DUY81_08605 [Acidipropionibacterium acidipropionici]|jgi:hypothetical protein|uniref:Uncharacterized protein n=1 Tax=Acidipropionibacterium acidipropionici TaxID=1748 RepID=A0AAC8YDF8_9ACTN|nr:hypothetical protein [Acidipropionibacterium acidipropionici]AMS04627.1 hypothetical protein AXH35_03175 [Acidipropionibacterium acidipropionici]AOZ46116.1 hypothetical protein A8L58_04640 [Acidipropionibacterium acidipropionici]AZP37854.1 hypothetical protein DUY81_08605 [Acidipropionibacterium acidipropionici]